MRSAAGLLALSVCAATAFAETPKTPPAPAERTEMLAPIQVGSLTLTPIVATSVDPKDGADALLVLDEAMAAKRVKIQEIADGNVNALKFTNKADRPVFVMAGE